jgi:hypothetical protein
MSFSEIPIDTILMLLSCLQLPEITSLILAGLINITGWSPTSDPFAHNQQLLLLNAMSEADVRNDRNCVSDMLYCSSRGLIQYIHKINKVSAIVYQSAKILAIQNGHTAMVRLIDKHYPHDRNDLNDYLGRSARFGQTDVARYLLEDYRGLSYYNGEIYVVRIAAWYGNINMLRDFISLIDDRGECLMTTLEAAASNKQDATVDFLTNLITENYESTFDTNATLEVIRVVFLCGYKSAVTTIMKSAYDSDLLNSFFRTSIINEDYDITTLLASIVNSSTIRLAHLNALINGDIRTLRIIAPYIKHKRI